MNYKDVNGNNYKLGDIVYNPCFNDYWVVQKCNKKEQIEYGLNSKYCLALYNDKNDYVIELDEPYGFEIVMSKDDEKYNETIKELDNIANKRRNMYEKDCIKENK